MRYFSLIIVGVAIPLGLACAAEASDKPITGVVIIAQADQAETAVECPPETECPPPGEAADVTPAATGSSEPAASAAEAQPDPAAEVAPTAPAAASDSAPQSEPQQAATPETAPAETTAEMPPIPVPSAPAAIAEPASPQLMPQPGGSWTQSEPSDQQSEAAPAPAASQEDTLGRARARQEELRQRQGGEGGDGAGARRREAVPGGGSMPLAPAVAADTPAAAKTPPAATAAEAAPDTTVEQQLEAQGDKKEADSVRRLREDMIKQLLGAVGIPVPDQSGDDRRGRDGRDGRDGRESRGPDRRGPNGYDGYGGRDFYGRGDGRFGEVVERRGGRRVIDLGGGRIYIESVVPDEGGRLLHGADDVEVKHLPGGRTRTVVYKRDGSQVVTVRDPRGDILRRVRVLPNGAEIVLISNRYQEGSVPGRPYYRDVRSPRVGIPQERYIVDLGRASPAQIRGALLAPPVQQLDQQYTLSEVLHNEHIRAYSPRIDLDSITFEFGSATIGPDQMPALSHLGQVMEQVIAENPEEVYLIEGHTDAVGSDYDNLFLSDRRAEAVAVALSQNFLIPPENLITEGYGEQFLKVPTPGPERLNRRSTVRRLTGLVEVIQN